MPPVPIASFLKLPAARRAAPVVVFLGDEPFFVEEGIASLEGALTELGQGERPDRVEKRIAGGNRGAAELTALQDELRTGSLFSPSKLVVVRDAESVLSGAPEAVLAQAKRAEAAPGEKRTVLALELGSMDRRTKVAKELEKTALLVEAKRLYADPPPWARGASPLETPLVQWAVERARGAGLKVTAEAAYALTRITGNDLHEIAATIVKIKTSGADEMTIAGVEALAARTRRDDAFAAADAFAKRDLEKALSLVERAFDRGLVDRKGARIGDPSAIGLILFGAISRKLAEVRRTLDHLARGGDRSRDGVAAALGIPAFLADRALADAQRFRDADPAMISRALLDTDMGLKGAEPMGGPRACLERLAVVLLQDRSPRATIRAR